MTGFVPDGNGPAETAPNEEEEGAAENEDEERPQEQPDDQEKLVKLDILILSKAKSECICCPRKVTRKCTTLPKQARIQVRHHCKVKIIFNKP